jgi:hypothetical protein
MLVDTGASVTILSQIFLNTIDPSLKSEILPVNIKMKSATKEISSFMASLNGVRTIFSYIPILQQVASPLFLYLKQGIS